MKLALTPTELRNLLYRPTVQELDEHPLAIHLELIVNGQIVQHINTTRRMTHRIMFPERLSMASHVEIRVE